MKVHFISAGLTCPEVNANLLAAQAKIESIQFDPAVVSGKRRSSAGAMGVSQFMPGTWAKYGKGSPYDPAQAIAAQGRYMCQLAKDVRRFPGDDTANMLAAYNAGPGAVEKYGGVPNYRETKNYIKRIYQEMN